MLTILVIKGALLDGASEGLKFYVGELVCFYDFSLILI